MYGPPNMRYQIISSIESRHAVSEKVATETCLLLLNTATMLTQKFPISTFQGGPEISQNLRSGLHRTNLWIRSGFLGMLGGGLLRASSGNRRGRNMSTVACLLRGCLLCLLLWRGRATCLGRYIGCSIPALTTCFTCVARCVR